jgi:hypothetical protein
MLVADATETKQSLLQQQLAMVARECSSLQGLAQFMTTSYSQRVSVLAGLAKQLTADLDHDSAASANA